MGIYAVKPRFRGVLRGTARSLAGRGVTPDQVTSAGVVASGLGALALGAGRRWRGAFVAVPVLAFARTAANALDGLVAEESGLGRPAGELYNETADRLGDIAFLAGTAAVPGVRPALALGALAAAELSSFVGSAPGRPGAGAATRAPWASPTGCWWSARPGWRRP